MGSVLLALYRAVDWWSCPGSWIWTTAAAGALIALMPAAGAICVSIARRFTGNRFSPPIIAVFGCVGALSALVLPWLAFDGVGHFFLLANGGRSVGMTHSEMLAFNQPTCFVVPQDTFLGSSAPAAARLFGDSASDGFVGGIYWAFLVVLAGLGFLAVVFQARGAFRRGPRWPRMLFWVPFVIFLLLTLRMQANATAVLWAGFVPAAIVGGIAGRLIGAPSWSVINRSARAPEPQRELGPPLAETPGPMPPPQAPNQSNNAPTLVAGPLGGPPVPGLAAAGGRFQRIRKLGQGGFGAVWLAMDTNLNRTVAVKIANAPDDETEQRMYREARALAAVRHPNCVRVYDIVKDLDGLALVMEYIEGRSLNETVRGGRLDDVAAGRLWLTMADALADAHGQGVLHRDIKPSNIVVDQGGEPHLIDFGIARHQGDATLTASGMMLGTPDFLPPEVAGGHQATPASDAWELAATVSYALTGLPPRGTRDNQMSALMAAVHAQPCVHLPQHSVHIRLLSAALTPNPAQRPPLAVVSRELTGWLRRTGAKTSGPVTPSAPPSQPGTQPLR